MHFVLETNLAKTKILYYHSYPQLLHSNSISMEFPYHYALFFKLKCFFYNNRCIRIITTFFATDKANGILYNEKQRAVLVRWFWRCCFSRRYSSGVNDAQEIDIENMKKLRKNSNYDICDFKCSISTSFFVENQFSIGAANTKTFILMLANKTPRSFISGAKVDLRKTLKISTSREFHHIFPDKYLQRLGYTKKDIYYLANFCFLNSVC